MTKNQIARVTDDTTLRLLKAARPYVEDRLHRPDGEIDGSAAQLLSSLDAAIGSPSPQPNVAPIRYVPAKGNTRAEMVENFRADPLYREGDAWLVFANEGDLHMQALRHATAPAPSQHVEVPEGWQLVPKIPTTEMECAPDHEDCPTPDAARAVYLAMLASAPPSPLDIVTVPVIHPIQEEISTAPIPPCPFCDCNDDVISLRDRLRDAQMAIRLARPFVEDRLHRLDGEIDGSVAQLLSSLDAAIGSPAPQSNVGVTLEEYFARQIEWSRETFGPALRTGGVIEHIRKELREIEAEPHDLSEWVDVVILAMDGFWRHGGKASDLLPALLAKQRKNMARTWPDWRTMSENSAIEHDRSHDVPTTEQTK